MGSLNQILAREMSRSKGRVSIVPKYDGGNVFFILNGGMVILL